DTAYTPDNGGGVVGGVRGVRDIGDALPRAAAKNVLAQPSEALEATIADLDRGAIALTAPRRAFGRIKPGTDLEAERCQPFGPDIDPHRLLQSKAERRNIVLEGAGLDRQFAIVEHDALRQRRALR